MNKIGIDISQIVYGTGVSVYTKRLITEMLRISHDQIDWILFAGVLNKRNLLNSYIARLDAEPKVFPLPPKILETMWNTFHLGNIEMFCGNLDLFHTSDWTEPPAKCSKVTTIHDLSFMIDPKNVDPVIRNVHNKRLYWVKKEETKVIAVSNSTKDDVVNLLGIPEERIRVIWEGPTWDNPPAYTDTEKEIVFKKYGINSKYILVPGSGHPRKNVKNAITAFELSGYDGQLLVIGRAQDNEKTSNTSVVFTGFVSDREYEILFSCADALFYPSIYEGFGIPILDAFVVGVPVITSNTSSLKEVAGDAAILVNPSSVEEMSAGIKNAIESRKQLVELGSKRLNLFSWQNTAIETLKYYDEIIKSK